MLIGIAFAIIGFIGFGWGAASTERDHLKHRNRCEAKLEALEIYYDATKGAVKSEVRRHEKQTKVP